MVSKLGPFLSGDVVSATASARPVLTFRNFSLRCDKSDPTVSFETPWNWDLIQAKKIAVITNNSFLRYQLHATLAGFVSPVSGGIISGGSVGWPVGGQGGLDGRLRISHALDFLSNVYADCLENSRIDVNDFWALLADMNISPGTIIKDLSREQKDYFYLALSVLFRFDCCLVSRARFLMSRLAKPLREILLKQLEGKTLISTSTSRAFHQEFCTDGLVLGPLGQVLFWGPLAESVHWADQNLGTHDVSDSDDENLEIDLKFVNSESADDHDDDFA